MSRHVLLALLAAALALAACDSLDRTKDWFSRSDYDPEIDAIEREIPPPEEPFAPTAGTGPGDAYLRAGSGGYVVAAPPAGMTVRLGSTVVAGADVAAVGVSGAEADLAAAGSESGLTRPADPPPLGWRRVRQGPYGTALAPFRTPPRQTLP